MKRVKHILAMFCAVCCAILCLVPAFASVPEIPEEVTPYAAEPPGEGDFFNLAYGNYYAVIDRLAADRGTYSRCYFSTGSGTIVVNADLTVYGDSDDDNRTFYLTFYDYETGAQVWSRSGAFYESGEFEYTITGLNPNKFYFFLFSNNSDDSASSGKAISGTIVLS